ncbi:hypothetical protein CUP1548 [Campylobacter upsaliensis RM3195]|nr:hypothetical protein CUP1548 [Campylobacter upsaliensis RM3195]
MYQYVSVFWHRVMRGDDKGARFFAVCISCRWCAWGL